MKSKMVTCSFTCIILVFCLFPELAVGDIVPEYQVVEKITRDISTQEKRTAAIVELSSIVKDSGQNMMLRQFAAEKLGELEAVADSLLQFLYCSDCHHPALRYYPDTL